MAESLPFPIRTPKLAIVSGLAFGRDKGGMQITSRNVDPYWAGEIETPVLSIDDRSQALAFLDDCVDRNLRIDLVHPLYRYPIGYTSGTWPMGLTDASLSSVTDLRTIVVSGLTVGITLRKGSRLALMQGSSICYRKVTAEVEVESAISQSISIGPRIPPGIFVAGATVRFRNPPVRVMVVPESWDAEEGIEPSEISFEVSESLR